MAVLLLTPVLAVNGGADWHEADFPHRAYVRWDASDGASAVLRLPSFESTNTMVRVRDVAGHGLDSLVLTGPDEERWLWFEIPGGSDSSGSLWVYYGGPEQERSETAVGVNDTAPWRVESFQVAGVGIPDRWERMLFMRRQAGKVGNRLFLDTMDTLRRQQVGDFPRALLDARTVLHVTEAGSYRFALNCRHAAYVWLDGAVVCEWPGEGESDGWIMGEAVDLAPGVYHLKVLNSYSRSNRHRLQVGWTRIDDGNPHPEPIPAAHLLAATSLEPLRAESRDHTLHAGFRFVQHPAYRVRGAGATFVPVTFTQAVADWEGTDLTYRWAFGDGAEAEGAEVVHTYTNTGPVTVTLRVSDASGREAHAGRELRITPSRLRESRLDVGITGVPAALFNDDRIHPVLDVRGDFQERALDVDWTIRFRDGTSRSSRSRVTPCVERTRSVPLASEYRADAVASIDWRVSHAGATLIRRRMVWSRPPFTMQPSLIDGDRILTASGDRLVWVADRIPRWRSRFGIPPDSGGDRAVRWLTDMPAVFPSPEGFTVLPSRAWSEAPHVAGPMVKFLDVMEAVEKRSGLLILGLGHADFLKRVDAGVFERQIAVLTDWLLEQEDLSVLWSTPAPVTGSPEAIRPYAVAVRRVADVRGVPVVDVYSYFMGSPEQGNAWIQPPPLLELTPAGAATVVRLVAEAMKR